MITRSGVTSPGKRIVAAPTIKLGSLREALLLLVGALSAGVSLGYLTRPTANEVACRAFCDGAGMHVAACTDDGTAMCLGDSGAVIRHSNGTVARMLPASAAPPERMEYVAR